MTMNARNATFKCRRISFQVAFYEVDTRIIKANNLDQFVRYTINGQDLTRLCMAK
jgi:hypothetical protein